MLFYVPVLATYVYVRTFSEAISLEFWKYAIDNFTKKVWALVSSVRHGIDLDKLFC